MVNTCAGKGIELFVAILVMDHGRLVERGTHDELVALGGLYKQLHDMQTGRTRRKLQQALLATTPTPPEGSV